MIDEDETVEVTRFGDTAPTFLPVGLDRAWAANRAAYIEGRIEAEEFEAEVERLLRKRAESPLFEMPAMDRVLA